MRTVDLATLSAVCAALWVGGSAIERWKGTAQVVQRRHSRPLSSPLTYLSRFEVAKPIFPTSTRGVTGFYSIIIASTTGTACDVAHSLGDAREAKSIVVSERALDCRSAEPHRISPESLRALIMQAKGAQWIIMDSAFNVIHSTASLPDSTEYHSIFRVIADGPSAFAVIDVYPRGNDY